jgi:hypothetical protein
MVISSDSPTAREAAVASTSNDAPKTNGIDKETATPTPLKTSLPRETSIDTSIASEQNHADGVDNTEEFNGDVNTNNEIPSQEDLARVEKLTVLDKDGKTIPFKDLYNGPNVARRVLIIFIRHFFCGVSDSRVQSPLLTAPS